MPIPISPINHSITDFADGNLHGCTCFSARRAKAWLVYLKFLRGKGGSLSLNAIREICSYLADLELAQVTNASLRFFYLGGWDRESVCASLSQQAPTVAGLC